MNSSHFMDKQIMGLSGSQNSDFFELLNPPSQEHNGSKKEDMLPSYDFQPIRPIVSPPSPELQSSSNFRKYGSLELKEPTNASQEHERDASDAAIVSEIDRTVKKHVDNLLHSLEGVSARLSQLESRTRRLENSVDELKVSVGNSHGSTDGKLRQLENILREVQASVQVLRDKQEIAEAHSQLMKLQLSKSEQHAVTESLKASQAETLAPPPLPQAQQQPLQHLPQPLPSQQQQPNPPPQLPQSQPQPGSTQFFHPPPPPPPPPQQQDSTHAHYQLPPPQQQVDPSHPHYHLPPPQQPLDPTHKPYPLPAQQPDPTHAHYQPPPQQADPTHAPYQMPPQQSAPAPQHYQMPGQHPSPTHNPDEHAPPSYYPPPGRQGGPAGPTGPVGPTPPQQFYGPSGHMYEPSSPSPPALGRAVSGFPGPYGPPPSGPNFTEPSYSSYNGPVPYGSVGGNKVPQSSMPSAPSGAGGYPRLPTAQILPHALPTASGGGSGSSGGGNRVPIDDVVDKVTNMGFSRDQVRATVRKLTENGQSVDLNVVLDKLMNDGEIQPQKGWFGRN
ncbi:altered inheritance of mitochondria protein 3 [Amborella trichopoda]|nr:altered inheritance of mitochondria protein 3 [Amborella trichopoda]|eukprot:XP_020518372.1 altered inheritance of mitochondria protein 3 [Amborella trichopoda]